MSVEQYNDQQSQHEEPMVCLFLSHTIQAVEAPYQPARNINFSNSLNELSKTIKTNYEALFLRIPDKEGKSDNYSEERSGTGKRRVANKYIDTFFTGCKDSEFINLSSIENKIQFEYNMSAFNQELHNENIMKALDLYGMKDGN